MSRFNRYIQFLLLLVLMSLIAFSFHPSVAAIAEEGVETHGGLLGPYVMVVFFVLFAYCFRIKEVFLSNTIRKQLVFIMIIAFAALFTTAFFGRSMMGDLRAITITVLAVMVGWQLKLSDEQWGWTFLLFGLLAVFVGFAQSFVNGSGLAIQDQYFAFQKNALGPIIGTAAIGLSQLAIVKKRNKWLNVLFIGLAFAAIVACALIRARAAMLSTGLIIVYLLFKRFQKKGFIMAICITLLILAAIVVLAPDSLKQFFYDSMYAGVQDGNIDSDRMRRNKEAIQFINDHIFVGNLAVGEKMSQIHNYPLNKLYSYGIVFAGPILILYLYVIICAIKRGLRSEVTDVKNCGYFALLLPFIVSLAEPTFPFGPGTATVFNFILFGVSLRNSYEQSLSMITKESDVEHSSNQKNNTL